MKKDWIAISNSVYTVHPVIKPEVGYNYESPIRKLHLGSIKSQVSNTWVIIVTLGGDHSDTQHMLGALLQSYQATEMDNCVKSTQAPTTFSIGMHVTDHFLGVKICFNMLFSIIQAFFVGNNASEQFDIDWKSRSKRSGSLCSRSI